MFECFAKFILESAVYEYSQTVRQWFSRYSTGDKNITDRERPGRCNISYSPENCQKILQLILRNCQISQLDLSNLAT